MDHSNTGVYRTRSYVRRYVDKDVQQSLLRDGSNPAGFSDVTDMTYLKRLNAFLCMGDYENMWVFPTNQVQSESAISISNRVEAARLERENASESGSESDESIYSEYVRRYQPYAPF